MFGIAEAGIKAAMAELKTIPAECLRAVAAAPGLCRGVCSAKVVDSAAAPPQLALDGCMSLLALLSKDRWR